MLAKKLRDVKDVKELFAQSRALQGVHGVEISGYRMVYDKMMYLGKISAQSRNLAILNKISESWAHCTLNSLEVLNFYNSVSDFLNKGLAVSQSLRFTILYP